MSIKLIDAEYDAWKAGARGDPLPGGEDKIAASIQRTYDQAYAQARKDAAAAMEKAFDPTSDVWSPNDDEFAEIHYIDRERFPRWAIVIGVIAAVYYLFLRR